MDDDIQRYSHILSLIDSLNEHSRAISYESSINPSSSSNITTIINSIPVSPILTNNAYTFPSVISEGTETFEDDDDIVNDILENSLYSDKPAYLYLLSNEGEKQLKYVEYNKDIHCKECPILKHDFEEGEYITELPCKHVFDPNAIKKWLQTESAICPVCRYKLKSIEVKVEEPSSDDEI